MDGNWESERLYTVQCYVYHSKFIGKRKKKVMAFEMGSSCLLHSPIHHCFFPPSSSSSHSIFFYSFQRNANNKKRRKNRTLVACMNHQDPNDIVFFKKRAILFMGISILPLLKLRESAAQGLAPGEPVLLMFLLLLRPKISLGLTATKFWV